MSNPSQIQFFQQNCHKAKLSNIFIERRVPKDENFVALLSDPHVHRDKYSNLQRKIIRGGKNAGSIIYTNKSLPVWPMAEFSDRDVATARLEMGGETCLLVSGYWDCNFNEPPEKLQRQLSMENVRTST